MPRTNALEQYERAQHLEREVQRLQTELDQMRIAYARVLEIAQDLSRAIRICARDNSIALAPTSGLSSSPSSLAQEYAERRENLIRNPTSQNAETHVEE